MQPSVAVLPEINSPLTLILSRHAKLKAKLKQIGVRYWKRLMQVGVPQQDAKELAIVLVRYSHLHCRPSSEEKRLIGRYCRHLCAVGLWQLELLLGR